MDSGFLIVCLAGFFFGTLGIAGRYIGDTYGLGPLAIGAWRILVATPALLLIASANGALRLVVERTRLHRGVAWRIAAFGGCIVAYQVGFFNAIQRTRVSTATMIALCTVPVFVAVISTATGMERLTRRTLSALALSVAGIILLSSGDTRA
ncbi:MAG: EamA family transporter, partial [Bacillota bacterium]